jgi:Ca-activated chloride channel family protein
MNFLWPTLLWLLLAVPLLVALYAWLLHRRKQQALNYPSLGLVRRRSGGQRLAPPHPAHPAAGAGGTAAGGGAPHGGDHAALAAADHHAGHGCVGQHARHRRGARPPRGRAERRQGLHAELPRHVRVGIVAFAGTPNWRSCPPRAAKTWSRRSTAFSCSAARPRATASCWRWPRCSPTRASTFARHWASARPCGRARSEVTRAAQAKTFTPVAPGSYNSAAIIMLTDGQRTTGPDPLEAAQMAADRGVKVYTVGVGTTQGRHHRL